MNSSRNTFELMLKRDGVVSMAKSILRNINQLSKTIYPSHIETLALFCDRKREKLFALLKKTTKTILSSERRKFVVCYDIGNGKFELLHKFSEETFFEKFGSHIKYEVEKTFKIHSIQPAPQNMANTNLCIVTESGTRIFLQVVENNCNFQKMIRPPNHNMFKESVSQALSIGKINQFPPSETIGQYRTIYNFTDNEKNISVMQSRLHNSSSVFVFFTANGNVSGTID